MERKQHKFLRKIEYLSQYYWSKKYEKKEQIKKNVFGEQFAACSVQLAQRADALKRH